VYEAAMMAGMRSGNNDEQLQLLMMMVMMMRKMMRRRKMMMDRRAMTCRQWIRWQRWIVRRGLPQMRRLQERR
jgi:hypothetical protein